MKQYKYNLVQGIIYNLIGNKNYYFLVNFKTFILNKSYHCFTFFFPQFKKFHLKYKTKFSSKGFHTFFGYYDLNPFSPDANESVILATRVPVGGDSPTSTAEVGYFEREGDGSFIPLAKTELWCWQQGCRLQWFSEKIIFYNKESESGGGAGVLFDLDMKKEIHRFALPLYDISLDKKWGLSLNFFKLQRLRPGYGYYQKRSPIGEVELSAEHDGLTLLNMATNQIEMIHTMKELTLFHTHETMVGAEHYLNHLKWSPDNEHFIFFHLWQNGKERYSRLMVSDRQRNLRCLSDYPHVSHFTWKNSSELLAYATYNHLEKRTTAYFLINIHSGKIQILAPGILKEDGHPSYLGHEREGILLDTYPNHYRYQTLYTYHPQEGKKVLSHFYHDFKNQGEIRCDLHPRLSPSGQFILVDTIHFGRREMMLLDMKVPEPFI